MEEEEAEEAEEARRRRRLGGGGGGGGGGGAQAGNANERAPLTMREFWHTQFYCWISNNACACTKGTKVDKQLPLHKHATQASIGRQRRHEKSGNTKKHHQRAPTSRR
jgi:hypothetical protein